MILFGKFSVKNFAFYTISEMAKSDKCHWSDKIMNTYAVQVNREICEY